MKIPSRPVRRTLRRELDKVHRIVDGLAKPLTAAVKLDDLERDLEQDLRHCEEKTRPAVDLADLWPAAQTIVGNIEPIGLRNPARRGRPDLSAACLRAAIAIVGAALAERRARLSELQDRHRHARAAFGRAVTAALAAGSIELEPGDMIITGDAEADGIRFNERVADFISPQTEENT